MKEPKVISSYYRIANRLFMLLWTIICPGGCIYLCAQNNENDTTGIIERIIEEQDTMVRYNIREAELHKTMNLEQPIDSFLFRNNNTRFKKELYNLLIRNQNTSTQQRRTPANNITMAAMDGRIIRHIRFEKVNVFAPSVVDTGYISGNWFEHSVEVAHNDTRKKILKRYLLFKPGDRLDVFLTAENERVLRDLPFIYDARFLARPVTGSSDSVDLILLTQDKLPVGLEADLIKSDVASFGGSNQNILGYGHQFFATAFWDTKNNPHLGYRLTYEMPNLGGSFIMGRFDYTDKWDQKTYLIDLSRSFRVIGFKNAGGVSYENSELTRNIDLLDTTLNDAKFKYTNTDVWAGHFFSINSKSFQSRSGFFLAGRFNQYKNFYTPSNYEAYRYLWEDRTLMLFSIGFTKQGFRKDNLIYTFGRTEDVPHGYLFNLSSGNEWSNNDTRLYVSAGASYSTYFRNSSYLAWQLNLGSFFNHGKPEQGTFRTQLLFFSSLHTHNRLKYRNFINLIYLHGINRLAGEYTTISNRGGIEGLSGMSLRGNDKLVLNLESVLFSPYVLLGFRFAFFGSVDLGLVSKVGLKPDEARLFSGLSLGVRIRNDKLVFNTFIIRLSIYPGKPGDGTAQNLIVDGVPRAQFNDFFPGKPSIVEFR